MSFTLEVVFTGLCMHLRHPNGKSGCVVLPDARVRDTDVIAADGEVLVPHVGYLRYNLADTDLDVPLRVGVTHPGDPGSPDFEVIHRFNKEELDFGLADDPAGDIETRLPELERFAPDARPKPGLFTDDPPDTLLMRCRLPGGSLTHFEMSGDVWRLSKTLNRDGELHEGTFAGSVKWKRSVNADSLTLTLRPWKGPASATIRLKPREPGGTIRLNVANLCSDNPVEWNELKIREMAGKFDVDFKWFYQLLELPGTTFEDQIGDASLPCPMLIERGSPFRGTGGPDDCTGMRAIYDVDKDEKPSLSEVQALLEKPTRRRA